MEIIYVPFTCNILTVGHIKLLQKLLTKGEVVVGVLTDKALKGYKKVRMPFKDRFFILNELYIACDLRIVSQETLDPSHNLKKYKCTILASGDGFEQSEKEACKKLGVKLLAVKSGEKLHSSDI